MEGMTRRNEVCSIKAGQVIIPFAIAEDVMYTVARVKTQFAKNIHVVRVSVKVEYRSAAINMRDLTVSEPSPVAYVNSFTTSVSLEDTVKPLGGSGTENCTISTDLLVAGFTANAYAWKV